MIQAALFDYGGVLSEGGGAGSVKHMVANALGIADDEVRDFGDVFGLLMTGHITSEVFLQEVHALHPQAPRPTLEGLLAEATIFAASRPVYELAARLRAAGIKTGILSNMFAFSAEAIRERELFKDFDPVLLSYETHLMKPDPAFYTLAAQRLGVPSQNIVFIDDRQEMTAAAERLGMQTVWAQHAQQIVDDTTRLIQEQNGIRL